MGLGVVGHPDPSLRIPDFNYLTPLYVEMKIATEFLHCTHEEFLKLPFEERQKLILFFEMTEEIEKYQRKQEKLKWEQNKQKEEARRIKVR